MNTVLLAIILGSLLVSSMFYSLINAFKNLLNNITITKSPSPSPAPAPAPSNSVVTITSDGIQFPKPSTTEGYMSNDRIICDPDHYQNSLQIEPNETPNAFLSRKNEFLHSQIGWCTLAGITDPKGFMTAYQYHDGDYNESVWDNDTKKCVFSGDDTPYACLYTEVKDAEGNVIGVENNKGEKLEVKFYNDYKSGKLQSYMEHMGLGTTLNYLINDDGKLLVEMKRSEITKRMEIKPGYNYPVTFMLLGTAVTMVDNNIDMPATGIPTNFQTLTEDEINTNMQTDLS